MNITEFYAVQFRPRDETQTDLWSGIREGWRTLAAQYTYEEANDSCKDRTTKSGIHFEYRIVKITIEQVS